MNKMQTDYSHWLKSSLRIQNTWTLRKKIRLENAGGLSTNGHSYQHNFSVKHMGVSCQTTENLDLWDECAFIQ